MLLKHLREPPNSGVAFHRGQRPEPNHSLIPDDAFYQSTRMFRQLPQLRASTSPLAAYARQRPTITTQDYRIPNPSSAMANRGERERERSQDRKRAQVEAALDCAYYHCRNRPRYHGAHYCAVHRDLSRGPRAEPSHETMRLQPASLVANNTSYTRSGQDRNHSRGGVSFGADTTAGRHHAGRRDRSVSPERSVNERSHDLSSDEQQRYRQRDTHTLGSSSAFHDRQGSAGSQLHPLTSTATTTPLTLRPRTRVQGQLYPTGSDPMQPPCYDCLRHNDPSARDHPLADCPYIHANVRRTLRRQADKRGRAAATMGASLVNNLPAQVQTLATSDDSPEEVKASISTPAPDQDLDEHHAELDVILSEMAIKQPTVSWLELAQQLQVDLTRQVSCRVESAAASHTKVSQHLEILEQLIKLLSTRAIGCISQQRSCTQVHPVPGAVTSRLGI
ncbi:hypothetical protein LTR95_016663 [Oleoguttula sp. CCFEE 5521]